MKILLTIIWLGFFYACTGTSEVKTIEELLSENTKEVGDTNLIMRHIDATSNEIKAAIDQQQVWLAVIKNIEELLTKLSQFLDVKSVVVLQALNNITLKSELHTERLSKDLFGLAQLQLSTKQQIVGLEQKMEAYQNHVLKNSRKIDNSILDLTKLITRAVLPQLNGLQCSFDSLETSQINVEVELKNLGPIKEISENTKSQLIILSEQLSSLNRTQSTGLSVLTAAVKQLKPLSSWHIESVLRELIISQKRIELDLETCEKRSPYEVSPPATHSRPHSTQQVDPPNHQSESTTSYYTSAYASAPQPKPAKPSNPNYNYYGANPAKTSAGHAVSWQQPLPWETPTSYQSVPVPASKLKSNDSASGRVKSAPNPSYSHQYQQKNTEPGQPISWYSVDSQSHNY